MKLGWQQMILWKLFKDIEGPVCKLMRRKAVVLTGLKWKQIYKWIFDRILSVRKGPDCFQNSCDNANMIPTTAPQVCDKHDFTKVKRVFAVEKIRHS